MLANCSEKLGTRVQIPSGAFHFLSKTYTQNYKIILVDCMPLFGPKKKKNMAEEIKHAVNLPPDFPTEPRVLTREGFPKRIAPREPESQSGPSPVFMKLDRYKDILMDFETLKSSVDNL